MSLNINQIKKKIIYRSNYRGTKEMDKLLGAFTNKYLDKLDYEDLKKKAEEYSDTLSALMVTYPSTHGVFEEKIIDIFGNFLYIKFIGPINFS